ncbi:unnamed protein product, partial [Rotaria sp. Silwood1]
YYYIRMILMTKDLSNSSLLHCRLLETSLGCSITIEYEKIEWQEDIQCIIRFHGRHCLSPIFPIEITRDDRIQMNVVYKEVGEVNKFYFMIIKYICI